jgi:predicted ribosome quality control (RQC) complex YloA/Tae2 family protein
MIEDTIYIEETGHYHEVVIGSNAQENDKLIKMSSQNDIWFHLDSTSSPHMVLKTFGYKIPKRYINYIGALFPKYKNNLGKHYTVIYTLVKNVKLTNVTGCVIPTNVKKIRF